MLYFKSNNQYSGAVLLPLPSKNCLMKSSLQGKSAKAMTASAANQSMR
jgi:hypothetical protein